MKTSLREKPRSTVPETLKKISLALSLAQMEPSMSFNTKIALDPVQSAMVNINNSENINKEISAWG